MGDVKSRVRTQPAQEAISKNKKDLCEGGEENKREREKDHVFPCPALAGCGGRTHTASAHHTAKNAQSEERTQDAQSTGRRRSTRHTAQSRVEGQRRERARIGTM